MTTNDALREQDRVRERVNAALDSGEAEVLEWHPDRPTIPKPSPNFGQWRQAVVRQHGNRNKAVTKQAELNNQLREERTTNDDQRDGCTANLHGKQYRPFCTCK